MLLINDMIFEKNFTKNIFVYYSIGIFSLISANIIFIVFFYLTKKIFFSLLIQYFSIFILKYVLYQNFKIFNNLILRNYIFISIIFFIINNFFLNLVLIKNIYLSQLVYTILMSIIGFIIMNKVLNK